MSLELGPRQLALIADLRDPNNLQCRSVLSNGKGYCCLGRACEVAIKLGLPISVHQHEFGISYNGHTEALPIEVAEFFGFRSTEGSGTSDCYSGLPSLTARNDNLRQDFAEIADAIEVNPMAYFTKAI